MVLIVEVLLLEQDFIAWCVMILIFALGVRQQRTGLEGKRVNVLPTKLSSFDCVG